MALLTHVLLPIASERDAVATAAAVQPYLEDAQQVTVLHVIEKGGGTADKAPMKKRREDATRFLSTAEAQLGDAVAVDTRVEFETDVVDAVFDVATTADATAVAFRPRGGSRIVRLLSGDTAAKLVTDPAVPVVSLPNPAED